MVAFASSILISLLLFSVDFAQCKSKQFAIQCAVDIYGTLPASASTVQSYKAVIRNNSAATFLVSDDAKAQKIWMFVRHGTRRPKAEKIAELKELEEFRDEIVQNFANKKHIPFCEHDWERLKQWKWDNGITDGHAQMLTSQGQDEIRSIAQNYKQQFPELFGGPYDRTKFNFQHTEAERTRDSFYSFVDEIFGENAHTNINAEPTEVTQALLKPYKTCAAFISQQENLKDPDSELKKFQDSKIFKNAIKDVSKRLGYDEKLKRKEIMNMFDMCRYEQAWNPTTNSIWCAMFTPDEVKVFEYAKDLSGYYEFGYGSEMNRRIQCSTVRDMVSNLETNVDPRVTVYFGHSSALLLHLTAMGAFEDEQKLSAKNFQKLPERKWSTSKMSPFAGNLAAVRYDNDKVKFFLNEELITFNWCPTGVCDLEQVKNQYKDFNNCEKTSCPKATVQFDPFESFFGSIYKSLFD